MDKPGTSIRAYAAYPKDLRVIGLDTKDGKEHPLYDPRVHAPLEESMVLNIMTYGVFELVECRANGTHIEVINGRRRVMHAREANKRLKRGGHDELKIGFTMKRGSDAHMFAIAISTNEHRLDDAPMAKAEKLRRSLDFGNSEEDCAKIFGVTPAAINQWMKLLDLSSYVKKLVDKREISASAAAKFSNLDHDQQKEEVDKLIKESGGKPTTRKAGAAGKRASGGEGYDVPGKRVIKRVIENAQEADGIFTEDEIKLLRWIVGDIGPASIKGLTGLMAEKSDPDPDADEE